MSIDTLTDGMQPAVLGKNEIEIPEDNFSWFLAYFFEQVFDARI